jgi:hypothetical protein
MAEAFAARWGYPPLMPTVDHKNNDLVFQVAVIGGSTDTFLAGLPLTAGEMLAQDVQGWHPRFKFEGFPLHPWAGDSQAGDRLESLVPYLDALVLNEAYQAGTHYSSEATERLSRVLRPGKIGIPAAVFGGPALAQEWTTLSGIGPIIVVEPSKEEAMAVLKALAKVLLRSRMRSTPPPPPAPGD